MVATAVEVKVGSFKDGLMPSLASPYLLWLKEKLVCSISVLLGPFHQESGKYVFFWGHFLILKGPLKALLELNLRIKGLYCLFPPWFNCELIFFIIATFFPVVSSLLSFSSLILPFSSLTPCFAGVLGRPHLACSKSVFVFTPFLLCPGLCCDTEMWHHGLCMSVLMLPHGVLALDRGERSSIDCDLIHCSKCIWVFWSP